MEDQSKNGIFIKEATIKKAKQLLSNIGLGIFGLALLRVIIYPPKRSRKDG